MHTKTDNNGMKGSQLHKIKLFSVMYRDNDIIIVNKAAGLLSIRGRWDEDEPYLAEMLQKAVYGNECGEQKLYPVHRLDKETSGVMVFALNTKAHKTLSMQFQRRSVQKRYCAVIAGVPQWQALTCKIPLTTDGGKLHRTITDVRHGKYALTEFKVKKRFCGFSLLEAYPITGRTHQIRAHLKHEGYPILCDALYGNGKPFFLSQLKPNWRGDKYEEKPLLNRLALHSCSLTFMHPATGKTVNAEADYPKDFKSLVNQLEKNAKAD